MNRFVAGRYLERAHELALGVEPIDAAREQPMTMPVSITHDDAPRGTVRQPWQRHPSNRQVLLYDAYYTGTARQLPLRLFDQCPGSRHAARSAVPRSGGPIAAGGTVPLYDTEYDGRRFVPRRLTIALPTLADAQSRPPARRTCRPHLWPGAAYTNNTVGTGLRAHAMRVAAGALPLRPARWVRVIASVPDTQDDLAQSTIVGRAHGDARGEFLLLVRFENATIVNAAALPVRVRIYAAPEQTPVPADLPALDPLWDLPLEAPATLDETDAVLRGTALPAGYVQVADRRVQLPLGQLLRGQPDFVF